MWMRSMRRRETEARSAVRAADSHDRRVMCVCCSTADRAAADFRHQHAHAYTHLMSDRNPFSAASSASSSATAPASGSAAEGLARMSALSSSTRQATSAFTPALIVQRAKAVTPAGWAVASMVGFVVVTIGYTQWDYNRTTLKTQQAAVAAKEQVKAQRKAEIRAEIEREANAATARR